MSISEQWAIVINTFMEEFEEENPTSRRLKTKEGREKFMKNVCDQLVKKRMLGKSESNGKYVFPPLILPDFKEDKKK